LRPASGDLPGAEGLLRIAVDGLANSEWHMGQNPGKKRFLPWESHLFGSTERSETLFEAGQPPVGDVSELAAQSIQVADAVIKGTALNRRLSETIRAQTEFELGSTGDPMVDGSMEWSIPGSGTKSAPRPESSGNRRWKPRSFSAKASGGDGASACRPW